MKNSTNPLTGVGAQAQQLEGYGAETGTGTSFQQSGSAFSGGRDLVGYRTRMATARRLPVETGLLRNNHSY